MKITFITFHNWETHRIGGFHKLAKEASKAGHQVQFFSFDRPYFIVFKHEERLNRTVLKNLTKGKEYTLDEDGHKLVNFTWPTFRVPQPFHQIIPNKINNWLEVHSHIPFSKIQKKYLRDTDVFVFESCEGIKLFPLIKKFNPNARFVYRPSDPLMIDGCEKQDQMFEENLMKNVDINFIVNTDGLNIYKRKISNFDDEVKYMILPNGVDTSLFKLNYRKPTELDRPNTFLYVGARVIEWELIQEAAIKRPNYNFIIICPETPPSNFATKSNITYIQGIKPSEVPAWVTNCDVIIVPNPRGWYKIRPWGITAKYYQAMEAQKPIVSFEDTEELINHGVYVAYDYDTFISYLDSALLENGIKSYNYNAFDWKEIAKRFLNSIEKLSI